MKSPAMYKDYLDDILRYYRDGQRNASLPQRMLNPTAGSFKEECVFAFETRFEQRDVKTLTTFFRVENDMQAMSRAVNRCDRDRFRPLLNFLRGNTNTTDDINIELLGWLIDFPRRPFDPALYKDVAPPEEVLAEDTVQVDDDAAEAANMANVKTDFFQKKRKKVFAVAGLVLAIALLGYYLLYWKSQKETNIVTGDNYSSNTLPVTPARNTELNYARCTGQSPCKACSNCTSCNWCNSGGTCSVCASAKRKSTQPRSAQCAAITKKGLQCKRTAAKGSKYCWQHG